MNNGQESYAATINRILIKVALIIVLLLGYMIIRKIERLSVKIDAIERRL